MHHIQRKILNLLMHAESLQYAQMRPKGIESNHFAYHLEQLVKNELVIKSGRAYSLSSQGLNLTDRVSHENMTVRKQPHIVTTLVITNSKNQLLVYKHKFQPYINAVGFIQGRTHFEESIKQSAKRELLEKSGLTSINLTHRGIIYITAIKNGEIVSKILSHVFTGTTDDRDIIADNSKKGECFWADKNENHERLMPGFNEINKLLKTDGIFFKEIETEL